MLALSAFCAYSGTEYTESVGHVKATVTNAVSPWFVTNTNNVGFAISVSAGSCKVEVSLDVPTACKGNTATPFDWDDGVISAGGKGFYTYTAGVSCARANCSSGTGVFFMVRR